LGGRESGSLFFILAGLKIIINIQRNQQGITTISDQKVSQLPALAIPAGVDLILIIDNPTVNAVSKKIDLNQFLRQIPANTVIKATMTVMGNTTLQGSNTVVSANLNITGKTIMRAAQVSSNGIVITNKLTPANSTVSGIPAGKFFYDNNYLYIRTANTVTKRIALSSF
jgi:hypothetical protein